MVPEDPETKDPDQEVPQEQPGSVVRPTRKKCRKGMRQTSKLVGDVKGTPRGCQELM